MSDTKHPTITVELVGQDGNAFMILGLVMRALRKGGVSQTDIDEYQREATAGDYNHLLATTMDWVNVA